MSRFSEYDDNEDFNNQGMFWEKRAQLALEGRRGRRALADLREALMALPEQRLISRALCTVGGEQRVDREIPLVAVNPWRVHEREELAGLIDQQGQGVCAIGAYVWHRKVKAGMDPAEAFDDLPTVADIEGGGAIETARIGSEHGLTFTLAWTLAEMNDADWEFGDKTPEERFAAFVSWIDAQLAKPLLKAAPRRERKRRLGRAPRVSQLARAQSQTVPMGLV